MPGRTISMRRLAAVACAGAAAAALAQSPGTYTGTTAQGYALSFVAATGADGLLRVTSASFDALLACEFADPGEIVQPLLALGEAPVAADGTFELTSYPFGYVKFIGRIAADGSAGGTALPSRAWLMRKAPHTAQLCSAGPLDWSATLTSPATTRPMPPTAR